MSLIYSRPAFRLPKIMITHPQKQYKNHPKPYKKKGILIGFILILLVGWIIILLKGVVPIFNNMCLDKARGIATLITNEETTKVLENYGYSDFIVVHKDTTGNILMLESNMKNMNNVVSKIASQIQTRIEQIEQEEIILPLGSFTGIYFLAGRGMKIPIRVMTAGNVKTTVKSELINQGINQTLHRLYIEVECEISILTPFNTLQESITNQVILVENILIGNIPSSYYNMEGITQNQALELIK